MPTRRVWALLLCVLNGCSTHPIVDTLDYFKPGRLYPTRAPYGGVCIPQGPGPVATTPSAPPVPVVPPPVPFPSGPPVSVPNLAPTQLPPPNLP